MQVVKHDFNFYNCDLLFWIKPKEMNQSRCVMNMKTGATLFLVIERIN